MPPRKKGTTADPNLPLWGLGAPTTTPAENRQPLAALSGYADVVPPTATGKKYNVILTDPPWGEGGGKPLAFNVGGRKLEAGEDANLHTYPTLSAAELAAFPVADICDDNCLLLMWYTSFNTADAHYIMRAWGFRFVQVWYWVKTKVANEQEDVWAEGIDETGQLAGGLGQLARNVVEPILVGMRGSVYDLLVPNPVTGKKPYERNVIFAPPVGHSVKPDGLHEVIDRMFGDAPKFEMFARRKWEGPNWDCVGNQAPGWEGVDIRDAIRTLRGW